MRTEPSKGERTRAGVRALHLAERIEARIAAEAKATLTERPGLNRDSIERLYADELTRRPVPNRATRRECKRRGHAPHRLDNGVIVCLRCEDQL